MDKDGYEIHVTYFDDLVNKFYEMIECNNIYGISNGCIKATNQRYNNLNNSYEIILNQSSTICASISIDSTIPKYMFHFRLIDSTGAWPINSLVDVISIVSSISSTSTMHKRDGNEINKCTLTIIDMSSFSIDVTLWGEHCNNEDKLIFDMQTKPFPPIILLKCVRVSAWCGKSLDTIFSTTILINPNFPEIDALKN